MDLESVRGGDLTNHRVSKHCAKHLVLKKRGRTDIRAIIRVSFTMYGSPRGRQNNYNCTTAENNCVY